MKQIINFIMSDKGYITVVFVILVIAFFISKKNLYDEKDKSGSSLKITVTMFILCMVALALYIIVFGEGITDANVLSLIASFTSPFIAFSGAYLIFEFGQKKSDKENKKKEEYEKRKKKEEYDKLQEHKKNMIYTMLEYSLLQTKIPSTEINDYYIDNYNELQVDNQLLANKYSLTGNFIEDFTIILKSKSSVDMEEFINFSYKLDEKLLEIFNEYKTFKKVIYIDNWYDYLDCIPNAEEVYTITLWINMIKNSDTTIDVNVFLRNRIIIDSIIKKNYPRVINEGLRGKLNISI